VCAVDDTQLLQLAYYAVMHCGAAVLDDDELTAMTADDRQRRLSLSLPLS